VQRPVAIEYPRHAGANLRSVGVGATARHVGHGPTVPIKPAVVRHRPHLRPLPKAQRGQVLSRALAERLLCFRCVDCGQAHAQRLRWFIGHGVAPCSERVAIGNRHHRAKEQGS
jgi:hypothetical protein